MGDEGLLSRFEVWVAGLGFWGGYPNVQRDIGYEEAARLILLWDTRVIYV